MDQLVIYDCETVYRVLRDEKYRALCYKLLAAAAAAEPLPTELNEPVRERLTTNKQTKTKTNKLDGLSSKNSRSGVKTIPLKVKVQCSGLCETLQLNMLDLCIGEQNVN